MAQSLNMNDWVTPNHWDVERFEQCRGLSPKKEFALIAPVLIYFEADATWTDKARAALKKLRKAKHPLIENIDQPIEAILRMHRTPDGLTNRYNALVMWLADEVHNGIESYIDKWGAFAFKVGSDHDVLAGDAPGHFAFFDTFEYLRDRIHEAVDAAEKEGWLHER